MQLAEQGRLHLDAALAEVLPEFALATPGAAGQITIRHLLSHSSGIDGDLFDDTGRGDDCVARYTASCARAVLLHPSGATMSYCNSGFVIAGRIVEQLTGCTWDAALRHRLIEPLELSQTVTLPEEAIRFRAAFGHIDDDGEQKLAPVWTLPRSLGPAGAITATASDVIEFARLHLRQGQTADGTQILSPAGVALMQQPQAVIPGGNRSAPRQVGLGLFLHDWDGRRVLGHDGGTIGQAAFLRVLPDSGAAVCLLTNGGDAKSLYQDLYAEIFRAHWRLDLPVPFRPAASPPAADPSGWPGRYEREGVRIDVAVDLAGLSMTWTDTGPCAEPVRLRTCPLSRLPMICTRTAVRGHRPLAVRRLLPAAGRRSATCTLEPAPPPSAPKGSRLRKGKVAWPLVAVELPLTCLWSASRGCRR